jgi:V/A-type H+-transporting ATPase subunit C
MSYEYLNTRLRFMSVKLLTPQQFKSFMEMRQLDELINALAETDYGPEIEKSSVEYSGYALVENALVQHVQRLFSKLYRMAFDDARVLMRVLLERFEVFNLKTILRGFHVGTEPEETALSLFPTILYPTAFYAELLKREGISSIIDYLLSVGNRYYKPLSAVAGEYESTGKLAVLESAIDSFYFQGSRQTLQAIGDDNATLVRQTLGTETDILNMLYALRVVEAGVESEEKYKYILQGGERLDEEFVRDLLHSPDKPSFVRKLTGTYYQKKLGEIEETITANELQERLENLLYQENCKLDPGRLFDIHAASVYIWRVNVEATNLRVIASGLWRRAPWSEVEKRLIWVAGMMPEREAIRSIA